ncbi:Hypothetical predicted protein [Lecanosticta acicola]|uniref:2EXR domain-containing protein n=1 Tax=Lecanosticta acicola TaxID=111012 RepID=A0AAI8YZU7_9PEZI|nr:Hypothetical predicted protein [Lecanosticta acicola]
MEVTACADVMRQLSSPPRKIPVEIRLTIYEYALEPDTTIDIVPARRKSSKRQNEINEYPLSTTEPALLRVCRQIRAEAMKPYNNFLKAEQARVITALFPAAWDRLHFVDLKEGLSKILWQPPAGAAQYLRGLASAAKRVRTSGYVAPQMVARPVWNDMISRAIQARSEPSLAPLLSEFLD